MKLTVSIKMSRLFGIVGSALGIFLLLTPSFGGVINLLGSLLILSAVWSFSIHTKNKRIFFFYSLYVVSLIASWALTAFSAQYLLNASEQATAPLEARLLQIILLLLPIISSLFLFKSYRRLGRAVDVRLFSLTAMVHLALTFAITLLNVWILFSSSRLVASVALLLTFVSFLAIPILGAASYFLIKPAIISYRSRT